MFTISKISKIQPCFLIDISAGDSVTKTIDTLRIPESDQTIANTKARYNFITGLSSISELDELLKKYFPEHTQKPIRDFFHAHPTTWVDLTHKIHRYRIYDEETKSWGLEESAITSIYDIFLVRDRISDIGSKLRKLLPGTISENQSLLGMPVHGSILDDDGIGISNMPDAKKRGGLIKTLLSTAMIQNINGCTFANIDTHLPRVLPKIIQYLQEILIIDTNIGHCMKLGQLSNELNTMIGSSSGSVREKAMYIIQAFFAWSGVELIDASRTEAERSLGYIPGRLNGAGIILEGGSTRMEDGATIYRYTCSIKGKTYTLEYRIKTLKSILQKMWESEEYNNVDAIRDILGITIILPDDVSDDDKIYIISTLTGLMPDFGYILKDKGLVGTVEGIRKINEKAKEKSKSPIYTSEKRGDSTDARFSNSSLSGFMRLSNRDTGIAVGTEIQFITQSAYNWKKVDDKRYKPRGALIARMRSSAFATPRTILELLNARTSPETLKILEKGDFTDIFDELLSGDKPFLIPYISIDGAILLFTHPGKEKTFLKKFPTMQKYDNSEYRDKVDTFLSQLKQSYRENISLSTPASSSLPLSQDQGSRASAE